MMMMDNFTRIHLWLEEHADCDLYSLSELHNKMVELSEGTPCYSAKSLKRKLIEHYGDHIFFIQRPGHPNLVLLQKPSLVYHGRLQEKERTNSTRCYNCSG